MSIEPHPSAAHGPAPAPLATPAQAVPPAPDALDSDDDDEVFDLSPPPASDYDLADYRWVPVRRRQRFDGWTPEKQRRFIEGLADTGLVGFAAKTVGMTREGAYRLRRAPGNEAFARAWDAARHHAGSLLEGVAFERAIEGTEHNIFDEYGAVVCTKRVYSTPLLTFLLKHLKPERYGLEALAKPPAPPVAVEAVLRELEPRLPEAMLDADTLAAELQLAELADGKLPHFLNETRAPKSEAALKAVATAERIARGEALSHAFDAKQAVGEKLPMSREEFADFCFAIDPISNSELGRKRFR